MTVQDQLMEMATTARESLTRAHELAEADMAAMPERYALIAIADQLAFSNALELARRAEQNGEIFAASP